MLQRRSAVLLLAPGSLAMVGCAVATPAPAPMFVVDQPAPSMTVAGSDARCNVGFPQYPALSPDGSVIVFSWAGDLWASPIQGGSCSRLTAHPADERRSAFSPDGTQLAFESTRDGARNLYVMPVTRTEAGLLGGNARRVTASDKAQNLGGFASDGKTLLFTSTIEPTIYRALRMYRVDLTGPAQPSESGGVSGGEVSLVTPAFGTSPHMASDGSGIVFYRGYAPPERPKYRGSGECDIWRMSTMDGSFTKLSSDEANDYDAWPLPDGSTVFISSRDGQNNVWRMGPGGESNGAAIQLTSFKPTAEQFSIGAGVRDLAVSADGKTAVFCVWDRMYRMDLADPKATPQAIDVVAQADDTTLEVQRQSLDKEVSEVALSPDGKTLAVVARGEVFVRNTTEGYPTRRVTNTPGRERDLAWSPDGRVLYFASDDPGLAEMAGSGAGANNLGKYSVYAASVTLAREDLGADKEKPKAEPAAASAEKKEEPKVDPNAPKAPEDKRDDQPKKDDAKPDDAKKDDAASKDEKPKTKKPDFGKRWAEALQFKVEPVVTDARDVRHPVPSPDARCLLVTRGLGDLVLVELQGMKQRVLFTGWADVDAAWAPDSRHIVYATEDLDFNSDIWMLNTGGFDSFDGKSAYKQPEAVNLTRHPDNDTSPRLSADGKVLTFISERGGIGGREGGDVDVYQVYLDRELEGMTAYERDEYYKKAGEAAGKRKPAETPAFVLKTLGEQKDRALEAKPEEKKDAAKADEGKKDEAKKDEPKKDGEGGGGAATSKPKKPEPMHFDTEDAYRRIRRVTSIPGGKGALQVTPGADRIVFSGTFDGEPALVSVDHKGSDRKTLAAGGIGDTAMSLTGDKLVFVKSGTASAVSPKGGATPGPAKADALPIDAPVAIDIAAQQRQKFLEAARTFGDRFYHPTMKGLDWPGLTKRYAELAVKTRTSEEFNRVTQLLFGETEGSHTGIMGGPAYSTPAPGTGYLGVKVKPVNGGYEVTKVTDESPAALKQSRINVGDVILAVEGKKLAPDENSQPTLDLDAALMGRAGRETLVELRRNPNPPAPPAKAGEPKEDQPKPADAKPQDAKPSAAQYVVIVPVNGTAWTTLRYQEEVQERRALVEKLSSGKLGYLHIRGMGEPEVRDYERDLYAAANGKDGLIIDVRDNGGGWTADILLASLTAPRHAFTVPRGADTATVPHDAYPRDRRLIYAWTRPIDVLINEHSFSNAEIFAHAIHTTKRGRLVGTPTFGGVISTGAFTLIDGTTVRMPFRGWYLPDGTDMENHGAIPDVSVPQTPAEEATGKDAQLEAAVSDLLKQVGSAKK